MTARGTSSRRDGDEQRHAAAQARPLVPDTGSRLRARRRGVAVVRGTHPHRLAAVAAVVVVTLLAAACGTGASPASPAAAPAATAAADPLDFTATTLDGAQLDASTLAGRPVVLWFWAPWCTICRVEAPDIAAVAAELRGDVTFLGVPGRGPVADMRGFVQDTGTGDLQHLVDSDGSLWQRFRVVNQPSFAFVGTDGSVELFAGALGAEQLRARASALSAG